MKHTTVFLDAGGVLLDEAELEAFICRAVCELLEESGCRCTEADYWDDTAEAILRYCPMTPRYVLWKRCGRDMARYEALKARYGGVLRQGRPPLKLYGAMRTEVPALAERFQVAYAGQYGADLYGLLAEHGLAKYFMNRLSQDDFSITKPDPRYIAQIAARTGVDTEACIMVGDRIDKDVIPGKQNGMATVFVRTGIYRVQTPRIPEETPDLTLDGLEGLGEAVVARWGH